MSLSYRDKLILLNIDNITVYTRV